MATNRGAVNFDWNRTRAFLATVEQGSLSAAAKVLNLTQPTLSRQITALETELGVTLFERLGKSLELTQSGLELLEHVRSMGKAANLLSLTASGQATSIDGEICITCIDVAATFQLPSIIKQLRVVHPGIALEIIASEQTSDLKRREADIAIRYFRPTEPDLIARKLPVEKSALYATPEYLEGLGVRLTAPALGDADFIGFHFMNQKYIEGLNRFGIPVDHSNFKVICNNQIAHWEMTKQGVGIGVMPIDIGDKEMSVRRVLPKKAVFKRELWLVAHRELRTNRRIKTVFDFLGEKLS